MSAGQIFRRRGSDTLPPLVWPEEIEPILKELSEHRAGWISSLRFAMLPRGIEYGSPNTPVWQLAGEREAHCTTLRSQAADVFAAANGWKVRRGSSPARVFGHDFPSVLRAAGLLDHPDLLVAPRSPKVVAIVSHNYGPIDLGRLPLNIAVDQLPPGSSWYFRGDTTAYVLRADPTQPALARPSHRAPARRGQSQEAYR